MKLGRHLKNEHGKLGEISPECDHCIDMFYEMLVTTLEKRGPIYDHETSSSV